MSFISEVMSEYAKSVVYSFVFLMCAIGCIAAIISGIAVYVYLRLY